MSLLNSFPVHGSPITLAPAKLQRLTRTRLAGSLTTALLFSALSPSGFLLSTPAHAENRLQLGWGSGYGAHSLQVGHLWTQDWRSLGSRQLGYGLAAEAAVWSYDGDQLAQLSLVPLLQYNVRPAANWQPVVYVGVGPAWISDTQLGTRDLSSEFQFSSRAGLGVIKGRHSLAVEARHLSNGGIKQPNEGISYWNLTYGYRY